MRHSAIAEPLVYATNAVVASAVDEDEVVVRDWLQAYEALKVITAVLTPDPIVTTTTARRLTRRTSHRATAQAANPSRPAIPSHPQGGAVHATSASSPLLLHPYQPHLARLDPQSPASEIPSSTLTSTLSRPTSSFPNPSDCSHWEEESFREA